MTIIQGDCLEVTRKVEDNSIDFIVTSPPYGVDPTVVSPAATCIWIAYHGYGNIEKSGKK